MTCECEDLGNGCGCLSLLLLFTFCFSLGGYIAGAALLVLLTIVGYAVANISSQTANPPSGPTIRYLPPGSSIVPDFTLQKDQVVTINFGPPVYVLIPDGVRIEVISSGPTWIIFRGV